MINEKGIRTLKQTHPLLFLTALKHGRVQDDSNYTVIISVAIRWKRKILLV
jgi:hypothetical protein